VPIRTPQEGRTWTRIRRAADTPAGGSRRLAARLLEDLDPEIEVHDFDIPDGGVYRGHDGVGEWLAHFFAVFDDFAFEPREYIDAGRGRVVLLGRFVGRGKGSGVPIERLDGMVWTVRGGKTVRIKYYGSHEEALVAVSLQDETRSH
jgi:ketosteroid isomerase-like protein